ncbi:PDZ domain-containing protein [Parashewanella curva]|uniref:Tricorn protease homolog n=1 Tax=Parashewanella curva TaxID=2338552 RepID=A0A3L8PW15_9GAMM|nr:S41 family peptidase [Parashewanella curva]RLV58979.1 PDZ domain-containing protein [Parashewanella curva]
MKLSTCLASVLLVLGATSSINAVATNHSQQGYYRAPTLHNNQLIFTAEGDLWTHKLSQSTASRLTSLPSQEIDASISKDGKWVAYLADYDGTQEVYVMPTAGGVAKRVTFENSRVRLQGWTEQGEILYSTDNAHGPSNFWVLRLVNPETLMTTDLPLADAVEGSVDDKGRYVYFTRFGLQTTGDNARVYRGGAIGEIWRYKIGSKKEAQKLTKKEQGSVREPMYWDGRVYFISDKDGTDNLWSMTTDGKKVKQLTHYKDFPIRAASLDKGRVVYQLGADIVLFDLKSNKAKTLDIKLISDSPHQREKWVKEPAKYLTASNISADGDKAVLTARGHIGIATTDNRRVINVTSPEHSRSRNGILSNDGKWVFAISDASGEQEIWRFAADGSRESKQMTFDGKTQRMSLILSPTGRYIANDDYDGNLWLFDTETGKNKKILSDGQGLGPYGSIRWSADDKYVAVSYNKLGKLRAQVTLYSLKTGKKAVLTSDKYESYSPTFSDDGKWLYFLSDRSFKLANGSPWGDRNLGAQFNDRTLIYAIALDSEAKFPFAEKTELTSKVSTEEDKSSQVAWKGLRERLWQVPVKAGEYKYLQATSKGLYFQDNNSLKFVSFGDSKPKVDNVSNSINSFNLSADSKKLFIKTKGKKLLIVDTVTKLPSDLTKSKVNLNSWTFTIDPKDEWQQIYNDAWLMHRDQFFDKNMRGVNWQNAKDKYQSLVDRVTDRSELNDVFKQMMSELNSLHSQVRGGDIASNTTKPQAASLGAWLKQTKSGVVIGDIYKSDPELPNIASPLERQGVNAKIGDVIIAINQHPVANIADVNQLLRNQQGKQVLLTLKRDNKQHKTVVKPVSAATNTKMRYQDWVETNQAKVDKTTDGKVGYLHLYAMGGNDMANFAREFYANYDKDGLIIDVRRNRGGNIDSWIIEKLLRKAWAFWGPTHGDPSTNMQQTFRGKLVVLADKLTYSDGETFTAGVRALKLAPVIGNRTAGAGVWLSGRNRVSDNGMARVAEYPQYSMDGRWIVEGYGVEPDIKVNNLPVATYKGNDAQLNKAISYLKKAIAKEPRVELKAKPMPETGEAADILEN